MKLLDLLKKKQKAYDDSHNFTCDVCGREVFGGERICAPCQKELPWNDQIVCPFCGRRVREPGVCIECKQRPLGVIKARSVFVHEGEAARLIVRFKRGEKYLFRTLAELALPLVQSEFEFIDAVIGVPMTERAVKKRGYNQAHLLAEQIAELSEKQVLAPVKKQRETDSQKFLSRREREKNLDGCFHVEKRSAVKGKRILIVDDTLTTGATVSALADALSRAGALQIYALTITGVENKFPFGKPPQQKKK
ncbi:MAG: ComF family protein [Clostridia bacterium]|nr:ComF family protein [Clostridia bacterium]